MSFLCFRSPTKRSKKVKKNSGQESAEMGFTSTLKEDQEEQTVAPMGLRAAGSAVNLQAFLAEHSTEEEFIHVQNTPVSSSSVFKGAPENALTIRSTLCTDVDKDGNGNTEEVPVKTPTARSWFLVPKRVINPAISIPIATPPPQMELLVRQAGRVNLHQKVVPTTRVSKARKTSSPPRAAGGASKPRPTCRPPGVSGLSSKSSKAKATSPPPGYLALLEDLPSQAGTSSGSNHPIDHLPGFDDSRELTPLCPLWEVRDSNNEELTFEFPGCKAFTAKDVLLYEKKAKKERRGDKKQKK